MNGTITPSHQILPPAAREHRLPHLAPWAMTWLCLAWLWTCMTPSTALAGGGAPHTQQQRSQQQRANAPHTHVVRSDSEGAWLPIDLYQQLRRRLRRHRRARWIRLGEARYKARYTQGGFDVRATIDVEVKGKGWRRVGILPNAYPLHSATINGKAAALQSGPTHGMRRLVLRGEGRHAVQLHFFLPERKGPEPKAIFHLAPAHASHLEVSFVGKGYRPKLVGGLNTRTRHQPKHTVLTALISPGTKPVLSWWKASTGQVRATKGPKRTARLYARTYALLSAGHGGQELFLTVRYTIVHAPREQFRLLIPKGIHVRRVHGLGIRDYRLLPDPKKRGQILDVLLTEPVTERYELSLLAEHRKDTGQIALRLPAPMGVQRETGYLGVEVIGNDALTVIPKGASSIDVQELPPEIIRGTQRPILRAYRFTRRPATWRLKVHKHKSVSVPAAMIDQALYLQVANHEGQTWVQATYQVRNTFKQFIAITLPKGARVQSAFVGGKPVKPARDSKKRVLIPLKRSGKAQGHAFPVEVVYSLRHKPFVGRSRHQAALPGVDLWIADLQWRLYLPRGRVNWDDLELGRERPRGYSQWSFKSVRTPASRRWRGRHRTPSQATVQANKIRLQTGADQAGGVLPVRIQLPRRGRLYIFHRYHLAPHRDTTLRYHHQHPYTGTFGLALFLLGGLLLGFALTRMALRSRIDLLHAWLLLILGGASCSAGVYFATYVHLTITVLGGLLGFLVASAIHIFQWLDKRNKDAATSQSGSQEAPQADASGDGEGEDSSAQDDADESDEPDDAEEDESSSQDEKPA